MAKGLLLSGYLPAVEQQSISGLYDEIVEAIENRDPQEEYVVVAVIKAKTASIDLEAGEKPPVTMTIRAAEVLRGDAADSGRTLLTAARRARLGPPPPQLFEEGGEGGEQPDEAAEAVEAAPAFGDDTAPVAPIGKRRARG